MWRTRFLPEHVYEFFSRQTALTVAALPPGHLRHREVPAEFISVLPLDKQLVLEDLGVVAPQPPASGTFGYVSSLFKVVSSEDGLPYALRRVESVRAPPAVLASVRESWARAVHPSIIPLRRVFAAAPARGGGPAPPTLFFAHDFFPGARSLRELYTEPGARGAPPPTEATLWSYTCQLVSALRTVHELGLTFRGVRAEHVLVTGRNRVRFAGAGVLDVLEHDHAPQPHSASTRQDVISLGKLLLQLAVRSPTAHTAANLKASLDAVSAAYSTSFSFVLMVMITQAVSAGELCKMLWPQMVAELNGALEHGDVMESLLAREAENGRLLRLLLKLGYVNERPEHEGDAAWAETGERYQLKLFRDFVFHQNTDDGRPVLDVAHAVDALQQLDAGTGSRVLLASRDGASILVSTYAALRANLCSAYDALRAAARARTDEASVAAAAAANGGGGGGGPLGGAEDAWRPKLPAVVRARTAGGGGGGALGGAGVGGRGGGRPGRGGFSGLPRGASLHGAAAGAAAMQAAAVAAASAAAGGYDAYDGGGGDGAGGGGGGIGSGGGGGFLGGGGLGGDGASQLGAPEFYPAGGGEGGGGGGWGSAPGGAYDGGGHGGEADAQSLFRRAALFAVQQQQQQQQQRMGLLGHQAHLQGDGGGGWGAPQQQQQQQQGFPGDGSYGLQEFVPSGGGWFGAGGSSGGWGE